MSKKTKKVSFGSVTVAQRGDYVRIRWQENKKTMV